MRARYLLAILAVFAIAVVLNVAIGGVVRRGPMEDGRTCLLSFAVLLASIAFVSVYYRFVEPKSVRNAVLFGIVFGMSIGASAAYGAEFFSEGPLPFWVLILWVLGAIVESAVAGLAMGAIIPSTSRTVTT